MCVAFKVKFDNPPKTLRLRDYGKNNAEHFAAHICNEHFIYSTPNSYPIEYVKHIVGSISKF